MVGSVLKERELVTYVRVYVFYALSTDASFTVVQKRHIRLHELVVPKYVFEVMGVEVFLVFEFHSFLTLRVIQDALFRISIRTLEYAVERFFVILQEAVDDIALAVYDSDAVFSTVVLNGKRVLQESLSTECYSTHALCGLEIEFRSVVNVEPLRNFRKQHARNRFQWRSVGKRRIGTPEYCSASMLRL